MLQINFTQLEGIVGLKPILKTPGNVITYILPSLFGIAGLILLLYLVWGGFMFMTSHGDQKAVENARSKITSALVGFIIIFIAYWLVRLLGTVLGITQFTNPGNEVVR